jgi:hypothetical protein
MNVSDRVRPPRELSEDDWDDEDGDDTIPCPHCRRPIHEDSQRCPHCEEYISEEDAPTEPKPLWLVIGVVACLAAAALWILGR